MVEAVRIEIARLWTPPMAAIYVAFVAFPTVWGVAVQASYAYQAPIDLFTLMVSHPAALVFPLLLTGLYVFRFSSLLQHRYAFYARLRSGTRAFLGVHVAVNVIVVGSLVLVSYLGAAAIAYLVLPRTQLVRGALGYQPLPNAAAREYSSSLVTFSQLSEAGTLAYVVGFASFVAVFSVVIATASLCFTLLARSRILGLALTLVLYTAESFVLAYAGLEQYRTDASLFPSGITQQPVWVPMVPLAAWVVLTAALLIYLRRSADRLDTLA